MKTSFPFSLKLAGWLISTVIIVYGLYILQDIILPLVFSILFAVMLFPACRLLEKWRFPRVLAIFISQILFSAVIGGLVYLAYTQVKDFDEQLPKLAEKASLWTDKAQIFISETFHLSKKNQAIEGKKIAADVLKSGASSITAALATTTGTLATAALVPIFVFLFLLYRDFFGIFFYQLFDSKHKRKVAIGIARIYDVIQSYLVGMVLVIFIVGVLNSVGLLFLGVDYAIFFGFFGAFLLLIPYIGIMIGSILPALMALITKDSPMYALGVLAIFGVVQILEGNFITPNIVGSKISINPLVAMIALIMGDNLWGVAGLILALPCIAIIKVIFDLVEPLKPFGYLLGDAE